MTPKDGCASVCPAVVGVLRSIEWAVRGRGLEPISLPSGHPFSRNRTHITPRCRPFVCRVDVPLAEATADIGAHSRTAAAGAVRHTHMKACAGRLFPGGVCLYPCVNARAPPAGACPQRKDGPEPCGVYCDANHALTLALVALLRTTGQ